MGCVHADGGNPRYVCNECEKDEPGLRARNRGWVRGDVLPEIDTTMTTDFPVAPKVAVPVPDQLEPELTKPFKLPGYGEQLFTFKTVDLTKLSEYERGRRKGSQEMLDMIRGSLKGFPDLGGDIEVIREIERIIAEATCYWRDEVAQLRETISNIRKEIEKLRVQV